MIAELCSLSVLSCHREYVLTLLFNEKHVAIILFYFILMHKVTEIFSISNTMLKSHVLSLWCAWLFMVECHHSAIHLWEPRVISHCHIWIWMLCCMYSLHSIRSFTCFFSCSVICASRNDMCQPKRCFVLNCMIYFYLVITIDQNLWDNLLKLTHQSLTVFSCCYFAI